MKSRCLAWKSAVLATFTFVLLTFSPTAVMAAPGEPEKIEFPPGTIEVNLERTVPANGAKRFNFRGEAGQEIALTITPRVSNATLSIDLNGKPVKLGSLYSTSVRTAGNFTIQILNADDVNRSFYLDLGLATPVKKVTPGVAEPLQFPKDDQQLNLLRTVLANNAARFSFSAKEGQEIFLTITPKLSDAKLSADLNGKTITPGQLYRTKVSKSGSFTIQIVNFDALHRAYYLDLAVRGEPKTTDSLAPERINFSGDTIEVNLSKSVQANNAKSFVFTANSGQAITLTVTPKDSRAKLGVDMNGKTITVGSTYSTKVNKGGTFTIRVINFDDVDRPFYLDLGVADR